MATADDIQKLYIAYFGRPADPAGLTYYTSNNFSLGQMIGAFAGSAESQALYGNVTPEQQVAAIYQNLFGRAPEPAGLSFWVNLLGSGGTNAATIALTVLQSAQNSDRAIIGNKLIAANAFTAALDTAAEIAGYSGADAAASARGFLTKIDATPDSIANLDRDIATAVGTATGTDTPPTGTAGSGGGGGPTPLDMTLTTGDDKITGTGLNDVFRGTIHTDASLTTYNFTDRIDGGAGVDTLVLAVMGDFMNARATVSMESFSDIERLAVRALKPTSFEMAGIAGLTEISSEGSQYYLYFYNVAENFAIGMSNTPNSHEMKIESAADLNGNNDVLKVNLNNVNNATLDVRKAGHSDLLNQFEILDIASNGSTPNKLTFRPSSLQETLKTIKVGGPADLALTLDSRTSQLLTSFDATQATGDVTLISIPARTQTQPFDFKFGSGDDVLDFRNLFGTPGTVSGGAGRDTLVSRAAVTSELMARVSGFEVIRFHPTLTNFVQDTSIAGLEGFDFEFANSSFGSAVLTGLANGTRITTPNLDKLTLELANGSGSHDSLTLMVNRVDAGSGMLQELVDIAGLEVLNIVTTAGSSGAIVVDRVTAKHVISGAGSIGIVETFAREVDTSALTGALSITSASGNSLKLLGGSGVERVTLDGGTHIIHTGAGDDTVSLLSPTDASDLIDGGDGFDSLQIVGAIGDLTNVVNFESLRLLSPPANISLAVGNFSKIEFGGGSGSTIEFRDMANATEIVWGNLVHYATFSLANGGNGTQDSLTVRLANVASPSALHEIQGLEQLNIVTYDDTSNGIAIAGANTKLIISGNGNLALGAAAQNIDASALAGRFDLNALESYGHSVILGRNLGNINFGAGDDWVKFGHAGTNFQSGGAAVSLGSGMDRISFNGSSETLTGAATSYSGVNWVGGFTLADDKFGFSANDADFGTLAPNNPLATAVTGLSKGAVAKGLEAGDAIVIQALESDQGQVAAAANVTMFKFLTILPVTTTLADMMADAMGTTEIHGLARNGNYLMSHFESGGNNNEGMVLTVVNAGDDGILTRDDFTGSGVSVVGIVAMDEGDYFNHSAADLLRAL